MAVTVYFDALMTTYEVLNSVYMVLRALGRGCIVQCQKVFRDLANSHYLIFILTAV